MLTIYIRRDEHWYAGKIHFFRITVIVTCNLVRTGIYVHAHHNNDIFVTTEQVLTGEIVK